MTFEVVTKAQKTRGWACFTPGKFVPLLAGFAAAAILYLIGACFVKSLIININSDSDATRVEEGTGLVEVG